MLPPIAQDFQTHAVANQVPPLVYDAWATDLPLRDAIAREGGGFAEAELAAFGPLVGGELMEFGRLANENRPKLRSFDRYGHRLDEIEFHPSYHRLMEVAIAHELPSFAWRRPETKGAHVARAALGYLYNQADQGSGCPLTMTYACVPTLRHESSLAAAWLPKVTSSHYDPTTNPLAAKAGVTIGMGMTEKQGGSDVRSNTTRAHRIGQPGPGEAYALVGHKWFFSAPMCDAWLVLAQTEAGLSCFLMPRVLPDGERNAIHIERLKDKLGDWSNASSEVELRGALGWMVGEEGRGIANILEMVALTRQDCMIGSAGLMRQATVQAIHHTRHRKAFGRLLIDQPLMANVLADLALESEAHIALTARVARAVDASSDADPSRRDRSEAAFARIGACALRSRGSAAQGARWGGGGLQLLPRAKARGVCDEPNLLCQLEHRADTTTGRGLRPRRDLVVDARGCQLRSAWLEWLTPSLDLFEPTRNFFLHRSELLSRLLFHLKSSSVL